MIKTFPTFDSSRIKTLREFNGLSHESFGKKIGKSKITIMAWEKGRTLPGIDDIHRISQVFQINPLSFWVIDQEKVAS